MKWATRSDNKHLPGLLSFGQKSGTGKTRVALLAAVKRVRWHGEQEEAEDNAKGTYAGFWFSVGKFAQRYLELARDPGEKAKWLKQLMEVDVLVLDDIDKIRPTEGMLELLYSVLDHRLGQDCEATILTTNLVGVELSERWGTEYGPYLVRRIRERCLCIDFDKEALPQNILDLQEHQPAAVLGKSQQNSITEKAGS